MALIQDRVSPTVIGFVEAKAIEDTAIKQVQAQIRQQEELIKIAQFTLPDGSRLEDTQANGILVAELLGPSLTLELFKEFIKDADFKARFAWTKPPLPALPTAELRNRFSAAANSIRQFSDCDANFYEVTNLLGNNFTPDDIVNAYNTGQLPGMVTATASEQTRWNEKFQQDRQDWMKSEATPQQLSQIAKQELQQSRLSAAEQQFVRTLEVEYQAQRHLPELPAMFHGQPMSSKLLKTLNAEDLRFLSRRHGSFRLSATLYNFRRQSDGTWIKEQ